MALATAVHAQNLVVNPGTIDLPDGGLSVAGWTPTTALRTVRWDNGTNLFANLTSPGPPDGGTGYFRGGPACAQAFQSLPLGPRLAEIQAGGLAVTLGGWFGGWDGQDDRAEAILRFYRSDAGFVGLVTAGPVSRLDRSSVTGLYLRQTVAQVPSDVATATLELRCSREGPGPANDGYFDELYVYLAPDDGGETLKTSEPARLFGCLPDAGTDAGTADGGSADGGVSGATDAGSEVSDAGAADGGLSPDAGSAPDPERLAPLRLTVGCGCGRTPAAGPLGALSLVLVALARKARHVGRAKAR